MLHVGSVLVCESCYKWGVCHVSHDTGGECESCES